MAKKKIGIYGLLESTANNKVEDLYLIVDNHSIAFSVKNHISNTYRCFEYFVNDSDHFGWSQLVGYLQNNSKLIQNTYRYIYFVLNNANYIFTKKYPTQDPLLYKNELSLLHDIGPDEEVQLSYLLNDLVLVFSIPDNLHTLLTRSFPTGKWQHYTEFLIHNNKNGVGLYMFQTHFCMVIIHEGQLKLLNHYKVGGDDQNTFNLLNTCKSTGTLTNHVTLTIAGLDAEQMNWIKSVAPYFDQTITLKAPNDSIGHHLNKDYPNHTYAPYFIF